MTKVEIEFSHEQTNQLVVNDLCKSRDYLLTDLEDRRSGKNTSGFWERDRSLDIKMIKEHIDAFNMIIKFYTTPDQHNLRITYPPNEND